MSELGTFEAAREFNVHPVTILNLIAQGRLQARKNEYNRWRINRKSLEQWNAARLARRGNRAHGAHRESSLANLRVAASEQSRKKAKVRD